MKSRLKSLPDCPLASLRSLYPVGHSVESDSRLLSVGDVFLAYPGSVSDGRHYIADALACPVSALLWEPGGGFCWDPSWSVPHRPIERLSEQAGIIAADSLGYPSRTMHIVGITGTNGKTSIAHWLAQAYEGLSRRSALIGTMGNGFLGQLTPATHTTPSAVALQKLLACYQDQGAQAVMIEVSSHGLDQGRLNGVSFETAIFTNLTRDHLDYHHDMKSYGAAKRLLFHWEGLKEAIINIDDDFGVQLVKDMPSDVRRITYGLTKGDIRTRSLQVSPDGLGMTVITPWGETTLSSRLIGHFNAMNILACLGALCVSGILLEDAIRALSDIRAVRGRMERLGDSGKPLVVIDYAHTPDALQQTLTALSHIRPDRGKFYCVFGCGGDRDKGKRPIMGALAESIADYCVVTTDNPRTEDAQSIINDIVAGMKKVAHLEVDRAMAIQWAIHAARANDVVLITGKGHEEYQEIGRQRFSFSDYQCAQDALEAW